MVNPQAAGLSGRTSYQDISEQNSGIANFEWITLKSVRYPATFLLVMDGGGNQFVKCGNLVTTANKVPANDTFRPIDRHGLGVNMLFGDFHVEFFSLGAMQTQDKLPCGQTEPNEMFAEN
jgi:prepilin-type processing-associated H-X9-DG protein